MINWLLKEFFKKQGGHIFYATILGRLFSFLASWVALQLISNFDLGLVIFAQNIIALVIPIGGFGATQGLLRYGSLAKTKKYKDTLFLYTIKKGGTYSFLIILILIVLSPLLSYSLPAAQNYIIAISFQIFTLFLLETLKTYYRIIHKNKIFAHIEIVYNILLLILVFIGSLLFNSYGYILAMILTPLFVFIFYYKKTSILFIKKSQLQIAKREFWSYSFYAGLSNVTSQLLIILDIVLIGVILNDPEKVTLYKYLSLIPFSLLFLPRVLLLTDFVTLTQRSLDKTFVYNYIKSYTLLFTIISVTFILIGWIFKTFILMFFGRNFIPYESTFMILLLGITSILILRGLFGNLLSVIGKAHVNFWISIIGILFNLIANYILIPIYGILGAAITSAITMWLTSIITSITFFILYNKKDEN